MNNRHDPIKNGIKCFFNILGQGPVALAGDHWLVAAAETAVLVRIPVIDGINITTN